MGNTAFELSAQICFSFFRRLTRPSTIYIYHNAQFSNKHETRFVEVGPKRSVQYEHTVCIRTKFTQVKCEVEVRFFFLHPFLWVTNPTVEETLGRNSVRKRLYLLKTPTWSLSLTTEASYSLKINRRRTVDFNPHPHLHWKHIRSGPRPVLTGGMITTTKNCFAEHLDTWLLF